MNNLRVHRIALIGGGAAAVSFCLQFFDKLVENKEIYERKKLTIEVYVFEKEEQIGPGKVYENKSEQTDVNLLNVPKQWMSPYAGRKGDFAEWLIQQSESDRK